MSAFLGPIHHLLYGKIKFQDDFTSKLIEELADDSAKKNIADNTQTVPDGSLEEIVDLSNIHGSLQNMIAISEHRLAYAVTEIKRESESAMGEILKLAFDYGNDKSDFVTGDAAEAYTMLSAKLLNGMPCDKVQEILERDEKHIVWRDRIDIHREYWDKVSGEVKDFYDIRNEIIRGLLGTGYKLEQTEQYVFKISKSSLDSIGILVYEHENILKMIRHIEKKSLELMNDKDINVDIFLDFVDFARNYADNHHHGKEELILFKYMVENLGPAAEKLVNHGMLVEHVLGRMYVKTLEESVLRYKENKSDENRLSILTNAMGYGELLRRHIAKENDVAYTFAKRQLSKEIMDKVADETDSFEENSREIKKKYESWLAEIIKN